MLLNAVTIPEPDNCKLKFWVIFFSIASKILESPKDGVDVFFEGYIIPNNILLVETWTDPPLADVDDGNGIVNAPAVPIDAVKIGTFPWIPTAKASKLTVPAVALLDENKAFKLCPPTLSLIAVYNAVADAFASAP